jgi:hypothetical protein
MKRTVFNAQRIALLCFSLLLASCVSVTGEIKNYEVIRQKLNTELYSAIGSVIFRLDRSSDLPNVVGGADIYGGKVDNGFSQVVFSGVENTLLNFTLEDVFMDSTETTMDRYKDLMVVPANNSTVVNVKSSESSNVNTQNSRNIEINLNLNDTIAISGYLLKIISFDGVNLRYTISEQVSQ